jgi:hypothetical protein
MQAIITKYLPATNFKCSRIKASCERGSIIIDYPHDRSGDDCHILAADMLVAKFVKEDVKGYGTTKNPWNLPRVCGGFNGDMAHVFIEPAPELYEALVGLISKIDRNNVPVPSYFAPGIEAARAALKKARGE